MKKRDIVEAVVEKMQFGGTGIASIEDKEVNFKGGITGQKVKLLIKKIRKNNIEAKILSVLEKSPIETSKICPHFGICGGCSMLSVPYEKQLEIKKQQLNELFISSGHDEIKEIKVLASPSEYEYKNKMEFTFGDMEKGGELTLGMHVKNSPMSIIHVHSCIIIDNDYRKILNTTVEYFKEQELPYYRVMPHEGYLRHLVVRKGKNTGDILVNIVTTSQIDFDMTGFTDIITGLELDGKISGVLHTINDSLSDAVIPEKVITLYGDDYFYDKILGKKYKIYPFSFFQTNTNGAEVLYSCVKEMIGEDKDSIFDLYSGTGTIGITVSDKAKKVIGIEIVEEAVIAAKENMQINEIENCQFIAGDVASEVSKLTDSPELIILDPPRAGIHPKAMGDIISFNAKEIIYISCNPKALMIDLKVLKAAGYVIKEAVGVDMFPNTPHVETVCLLTR